MAKDWEPASWISLRRDGGVFLIDVDETWVARYEFEYRDGAPVFTEVRVFAGDARKLKPDKDAGEQADPAPPGGLAATALRRVTPGEHLGVLYRRLGETADEAERKREIGPRLSPLAGRPPFPSDYTTVPAVATFQLEDYELSRDELRRTSRRPRAASDLRYAKVAARYVAAVTRGSRRPAAEVAEEMTRDGGWYEPQHVKELTYEARRRGFLTPTRQGRPGGQLTEKALEVLRGA